MKDLDSILYEVSKPARYTGGEWNCVTKHWESIPFRILLAFPDTYEIGMSNMAIPILYRILNNEPDVLAERAYTPWVDMEEQLRINNMPLFSLETKHPISEFDVIGFSLGYELTYTNVLNMLDLGRIPLLSKDRNEFHPLIIAGGSCALNPEPMADFIDLFVIGDAEEIILRLLDVFRKHKGDKGPLLRDAARLPGIYVPGFYDVEYDEKGIFVGISPVVSGAKSRIKRRVVTNLPPGVILPVVPFI
jgi:radical SAM superfamily enzyme YgiQ (UPF0313 family)